MSTLTANMGLFKGVDVDDAENYLHVSLAASLDKIDGHQHGGGADGLPVTALAAGATGAGFLDVGGTIRANSQTPPASGTGVELAYYLGVGYLTSYSRGGAGVQPLVLNTYFEIFPSGGAALAPVPLDPGPYGLVVHGPFSAQSAFIVQPSGGVYVGVSLLDPGANNLQIQNWAKAGFGAVSAVTGNELIAAGANQVGVHLYNEGTVTEWLMRQPAGATGHWLDLAKLVSSTVTPVLRLYPSTGVSIGQTPTDPGANNLTVQGTMAAANLSTTGLADVAGTLRTTGQSTLASGAGVELAYFLNVGFVASYDRAAAAYHDLVLNNALRVYASGGGYYGSAPTGDPGVGNLTVEGTLQTNKFHAINATYLATPSLVSQSSCALYAINQNGAPANAVGHDGDICFNGNGNGTSTSPGAIGTMFQRRGGVWILLF